MSNYDSRRRIKTTDTKITKLDTGMVHASRYLAQQLILHQKAKCQGHRVKKCKNSHDETAVRRRLAPLWRHTAGVSYALYRVLSI